MKRSNRRQRQQILFAGILAAIGVINLLFFLILYRPARSEYYRLLDSIERLRTEIRMGQESVDQLGNLSAQLETSEQDRRELFTAHFIQRDAGFSQILLELDNLALAAGVRKSKVEYAIAGSPQYGLYSVKIRLPVQGGYSNIVTFIRSLETSGIFFIIESIDVRRSAEANLPDATSDIALFLSLETFFYQ